MKEYEFRLTVVADDEVRVHDYVREVLSQLEGIDGVSAVMLERGSQEERDISEVYQILSDLSDDELEQLESSIRSYTEADDE